ncbi:hypothetical protein ACH413_46915 [Lentzea sp. NPDC020367]|uniref:magnesium chelatase subunit ChlI family protein n=1 Tax=Lentzea sp. NPDC020367 TaxID=3364125 RepID=UPI00378C9834
MGAWLSAHVMASRLTASPPVGAPGTMSARLGPPLSRSRPRLGVRAPGGAALFWEVARQFSYFTLLAVAWTLADLAEADRPTQDHVAAALQFRERRAP